MAFNLTAIMDAIAARLVAGLPALTTNVFGWPAADAPVPSAVVAYPEDPIDYDLTFGGGADHVRFPVYILVGKPDDRSARDTLSTYVSRDGARSVKAAIEGPNDQGTLGGVVDSVAVQECTITTFSLAGTEYLAARFDLDILA